MFVAVTYDDGISVEVSRSAALAAYKGMDGKIIARANFIDGDLYIG